MEFFLHKMYLDHVPTFDLLNLIWYCEFHSLVYMATIWVKWVNLGRLLLGLLIAFLFFINIVQFNATLVTYYKMHEILFPVISDKFFNVFS